MSEKILNAETLKDVRFVRYIKEDGTMCFSTENGERILFDLFSLDDKILISTARDAVTVARLLASVSARKIILIKNGEDIVWQLG